MLEEAQQSKDTASRSCEWPDCAHEGVHRAPRDRDNLRDYRWLCLEHVREYNAHWNYFAGMADSEWSSMQKSQATWERPTWPMGARSGFAWQEREKRVRDDLDALAQGTGARPRGAPNGEKTAACLPPEQERALAVLDLDGTATLKDVKKRFKQLVKRYHPDANGGPKAPTKASQERLRRVIEAYAQLKKSGLLTDTV